MSLSFATARLSARTFRQCKPLAYHSAKPFGVCTRTIVASAAPADQPKVNTTASEFYVLQYKYVPEILEKRAPHREAHLAAAREWGEQGKLVIAGALTDPVDGALFVFKGASTDEIKGFVAADPYVQNALVTESIVRPLATVVAP